jgi:hypothetical protein
MSRLCCGRGRARLLNASRAEQQARGGSVLSRNSYVVYEFDEISLPKVIFRLKLRLRFLAPVVSFTNQSVARYYLCPKLLCVIFSVFHCAD